MSENTLPSSPLVPGYQLGNYTIQSLIGRGKYAEVYHALYPKIKSHVALKLFPLNIPQTAEIITRFQEEMLTIATLRHPNIIRIIDFGVEENRYYLAMELVADSILRDTLSANPAGLKQKDALRIFNQIASAVAAAHEHTIVHGNIKPDNVQLDQNKRPILTDFMIPCLQKYRNISGRPGILAYLAPEQATAGTTTPQTDVYALGILLYEMVTGEVPFKGTSRDNVILQLQHKHPVPPRQITVDLNPHVEHIILQALNKKPEERYASARDLLIALEKDDESDSYDTLALKRKEPPKNRKRRSEIRHFEQSRLTTQEREKSASQSRYTLPLPLVFSIIWFIVVGLLLVSILL